MFQNINSVCFSEIVDFKPCLNLVNVTKKDESVSATTKTGYVEALIRLLQQTDNDSKDREMGLRMREVMMSLRLPLTNDKEELRSSTLKLVRYLVRSEKDVVTQVDKKIFCPYFNSNICQVNLHHFIVRSLDQDLENRPERIQAVKLARKLLVFGNGQFPVHIVRCLVAIVQREDTSAKIKSKDELWRTSLAVLCELSCINLALFQQTGLVRVLTNSLLECTKMPKLSEAVTACLMRLFCHPKLRQGSLFC